MRCSSSSSVLEVVAYFEELVDLGAGHRRWEDQHVTACASAPTWNSAAFNGASNAAAMAEPLSAATVASNMSLRLMRHRGPSLRTHITKSSTTPSKLGHQSAGRQINCDPCDRHKLSQLLDQRIVGGEARVTRGYGSSGQLSLVMIIMHGYAQPGMGMRSANTLSTHM